MNPRERVTVIRKAIARVEESCRSDEVAEACEALRDGCDALDVALEDEFGPRAEEIEGDD